jgi:MFS family permease
VRTAVRRYRALFATPGVLRVALPSLIGRLPIGMSTLLFVLVVHAGTGSYGAAGLATAANAALTAVTAPALGRLADRGRPVAVLVWTGVGQAALFGALVVGLRAELAVPLVVALAGLAGALNPPIGAVTRVVLPRLARDPEAVQTAFALDAISVELTFVVGPMVVGVVAAILDPYAAAILAAALTAAGAVVLATAPAVRSAYAVPRPVVPPRDGRRWRRDRRGGDRRRGDRRRGERRRGPLRARGMVVVLAVAGLEAAAYGVMEVAIPAHAGYLGQADSAGALVAVWSAGSIVGGLWYSGRTFRTPPHRQYAILMCANVVGFGSVLLATDLPSLGVLLFLAGLVISPTTAVEYTLVTALAPRGTETEAFTWSGSAVYLGFAGGSALAGSVLSSTLATARGLAVSAVVATGLVFAGAVLAVAYRRRLQADCSVSQVTTARSPLTTQ